MNEYVRIKIDDMDIYAENLLEALRSRFLNAYNNRGGWKGVLEAYEDDVKRRELNDEAFFDTEQKLQEALRKNEELLKVNAKYADMHFKTYEQDNYFPVDPEFLKKVKSVVINFRED